MQAGQRESRIVLDSLRDAAAAALIAAVLALPLLGIRLSDSAQGGAPEYRLLWVLYAAIAVFFGHLAITYGRSLLAKIPLPQRAGDTSWNFIPRTWLEPLLLAGMIAFAIMLPLLPFAERNVVDRATLILIYVLLATGLNIVVGLAGLLDLGYVAFYAVGAYSYALLAASDPVKQFMAEMIGPSFWPLWAFWICLPVAGILAAFWGIVLGFPVLRLRGDYLAIVTLAFGEIIRLVLINWIDLTNGYAGISGIPRPSFFGIPFNASESGFSAVFGLEFSPLYRTIFLFYLILALALLTNWVTLRLRRLPVGRAWEALREDEIACRSLGINTTSTKLTAFAIGAGFGGFAGAFFAARQNFISPESFTFMESAIILAIVVLGGMGSQIGVAIAAVAMIGGTEILRELDLLKHIFGQSFDPAQYRMLIFGLAMVLVMIWRPRGLISTRYPSIYLKDRTSVSGALVKEGRG